MQPIPNATFFNLPVPKHEKILDAARNEFYEYGFDLSSIQRIIKASGIPRGSFYQYFDDKTDLYGAILQEIAQQKIKFLSPVLSEQDRMGFFDFLKQTIRLGIKWARKNPTAIKISKEMFMTKTLKMERLKEKLAFTALEEIGSDTHSIYLKPILNSIERGEISGDVPAETICFYTQTMMSAILELITANNRADPFGEEDEKNYNDFINMMKFGLYIGEIKSEGED